MITGVMLIDLSKLPDRNGWIDTLSPEARYCWCSLDHVTVMPTHVRVDIGTGVHIEWPGHFLEKLAGVEHVEIVGDWPEAICNAIAALRLFKERAA